MGSRAQVQSVRMFVDDSVKLMAVRTLAGLHFPSILLSQAYLV